MNQKLSRNLSALPTFDLHMDDLGPYTQDIKTIRQYRNALLYHRNEFLAAEFKQNYRPFCGDAQLRQLTLDTLQAPSTARDFSKLAEDDPRNYFQFAVVNVLYSTDQDNSLPILINLITLYAPGFLKVSETANENYLIPMFDAFREQQLPDDNQRSIRVRSLIKEIWHQNLVDTDALKAQLKLNVTKLSSGNVNDAIDNWIELSYVKFQSITKGCDLPSEGYSNDLSETPFQNFDMLVKYTNDPVGTCRAELNNLKASDNLSDMVKENQKTFIKQPKDVVSIVAYVEDFAKIVIEPIRMNYILFYIIFTVFWNSPGDYFLANTPLKIPQAIKWHSGVSEEIFDELNTCLVTVETQPPFNWKFPIGENSWQETSDKDSFIKNQVMDIFSEDSLTILEKNQKILSMSMSGETVIQRYRKHLEDLQSRQDFQESEALQTMSGKITDDINKKLVEMQGNAIATLLYQQIRFPLLNEESAFQTVNDNTTKIKYNQLNGKKKAPTVLFETEMMPTLPIPNLAVNFEFLKSFDDFSAMQQALYQDIMTASVRKNRSLLEAKTGPVTDLDLTVDDKGVVEVTVHQRLIIV